MENTTIKFETEPIDNATLLKLLGRPTTLADIDELIAVQGDEEAHFIRVVYCKDCKYKDTYCRMIRNEKKPTDFCSYAERIENAKVH